MARPSTFNAFVLDQLSGLPMLQIRPMFGCYGLYCGGLFFAIIMDDRLFFRTDETTVGNYLKMGMQPLIFRESQKINSYYEVPDRVVKNRKDLTTWAQAAINCQRQRKLSKKSKR